MSYREVVLVFILTATVAFAFPRSEADDEPIGKSPQATQQASESPRPPKEPVKVPNYFEDNDLADHMPEVNFKLRPSNDMANAHFDLALVYPEEEEWSIIAGTVLVDDQEFLVTNLEQTSPKEWRFSAKDLGPEAKKILSSNQPTQLAVRVRMLDDRMRFSRMSRVYERETEAVLWALK